LPITEISAMLPSSKDDGARRCRPPWLPCNASSTARSPAPTAFWPNSWRRKQAALEAEAAEERRADAEQARADAWRCRELGQLFDDAFRAHGQKTPEPRADERPSAYRRGLFESLRHKLPDSHDLAGVRADQLPSGDAYLNFEAIIISAAKQEGERPSEANLPPSGEMVARHRVDDTGVKTTEWFGKSSFIKDMGRPGRRVLRIVDRGTGSVIFGAPFPQARSFY
jgi:hypothetical protein